MTEVPFYSDWRFWQWTVSVSALIVSLAPHIYNHLIKGAKITLDLGRRIVVHHTMGNPNVTLFLIIQNVGGKTVKVRSITLELKKDGKCYTIPAQSYYPEISEPKLAILPPFRLAANVDWTHNVYLFPAFSRENQIKYQKISSDLKSNILPKIPVVAVPGGPGTPGNYIEADAQFAHAVIEFFNQNFMWEVGEYTGTITVNTEPKKATISKTFRFTLFESESTELRNYSNDYKYGLGVYFFNSERQPGIGADINVV
jgi:hypothetical protein